MTERTKSIYQLVRLPSFYTWLQDALGSHGCSVRLIDEIIRPDDSMRILDVGCGPGIMRPYLGNVNYTGVDLNARHIEAARGRANPSDTYIVGDVVTDLTFLPESFDLILLIGILHHLDNEGVRALLRRLMDLLHRSGRIVTFDGVYIADQRRLAKWLLDNDAGKHVRTDEEYLSLCGDLPADVTVKTYQDLLRVPYDHFAMTITHAR